MKAIIIQDHDARALLDQLELAKLLESHVYPGVERSAVEAIHRRFHYVVTRCLQEQGASVVR